MEDICIIYVYIYIYIKVSANRSGRGVYKKWSKNAIRFNVYCTMTAVYDAVIK